MKRNDCFCDDYGTCWPCQDNELHLRVQELEDRLANVEFALQHDQHLGSFASLYAGVWDALKGRR